MERTKTEWEDIIGHTIRMDTYVVLERIQKGELYKTIINDIDSNRSKYGLTDKVDLVKMETVRGYLKLVNYYPEVQDIPLKPKKEEGVKKVKTPNYRVMNVSGGGVYGIYSDDDIIYIGSTQNFHQRFLQHKQGFKNSNESLYAMMRREKQNGKVVRIAPIINLDEIRVENGVITKRDMQSMELALITLYKPICNYSGRVAPFIYS